MSAGGNIPASKRIYNQIQDPRRPGESLDDTLARIVETVRKQRLADEVEEV